MNVRQMHIELEQRLQRIDSNAQEVFLDEEKDIALNNAQIRFIKTHYHPFGNKYREGYDQSVKRIEDLRHLEVTDYELNSFINIWDDQQVKIDLPADQLFLTRTLLRVIYEECNKNTVQTTRYNSNYTFIEIPFDYLNDVEQLTKFKIDVTSSSSTTTYPASFDHTIYRFPEDSETFINDLKDKLGGKYETYKNTHRDGSFIMIVSDTVQSATLTVEDSNNSIFINRSLFIESGSYQFYSYSGEEGTSTVEWKPGYFSRSNTIDPLLNDHFDTTRPEKPLYTIRSNYIDAYIAEDFFIDKARIDYIRWPKRISKQRNQDCELPAHTHDEIVADAVSTMAGYIADQRYKYLESEVKQSE